MKKKTIKSWIGLSSNKETVSLTADDAIVATAALSCVDGDDNTNGQFTEGEYVQVTSTDGKTWSWETIFVGRWETKFKIYPSLLDDAEQITQSV